MVHRNRILNLLQSIAKFNGIWQRPIWRRQFSMPIVWSWPTRDVPPRSHGHLASLVPPPSPAHPQSPPGKELAVTRPKAIG
jgi:hypothetical protein